MSQFSIDADKLIEKTVASDMKDMKEDYVELSDYIGSFNEESLDISISGKTCTILILSFDVLKSIVL